MTSLSPPSDSPVAASRAKAPGRAGSRSLVGAYVELTKPRITLLLLITCVSAMVCAAEGLPSFGVLVATAIGLAASSAGASALNHVLDRDIDGVMSRTASRPVVTGQVSAVRGAAFGVALMAAAGVLLWVTVNPLTSVLALGGGVFYVVVYTLILKRTTPQNIVIGGAAGAAPPLVGWAAVTGTLDPLAWELFAIIFFWTPPHFWALALLIQEEYAAAKVPMLPVVAGERHTVRAIWWYTLVLVVSSLVPVATGDLGAVYAVGAVGLGGWLGRRAWQLRAADGAGPGQAAARAMFLASMGYLALIFLAAVLDRALLHFPLV